MIMDIIRIIGGAIVSALWRDVCGYLVTAIKKTENQKVLQGADKAAMALRYFAEEYEKYEGSKPGAAIMRKAAEQLPLVHDRLEEQETL